MESIAVNMFIAMDSISRSVDILPVKIVGAQKKRRGIKIRNQMPALGLNIIGSFIRFQSIPLVLKPICCSRGYK